VVLVSLPTKLGDFVRANVGQYSSTMDHLGYKSYSSTAMMIKHPSSMLEAQFIHVFTHIIFIATSAFLAA